MSPPSVTRVLAGLETRLGTLLLVRSTRSLRLTEAVRRYVEDCKRILLELEEAEELATGSSIRARGNLTVTAPVMFGEWYLIPLITEYLLVQLPEGDSVLICCAIPAQQGGVIQPLVLHL